MKSGLKAAPQRLAREVAKQVATYAAMKSGLKGIEADKLNQFVDSVATYAAMKSGLKESSVKLASPRSARSNLCRDEKRTESAGGVFLVVC